MYAEYLEERENNQKTKKTLEEENNNLSILREQDSVKIQEFEVRTQDFYRKTVVFL